MYDTINIKKARQECLRYRQKRFAFWFDTRYDFCRAFFVLIPNTCTTNPIYIGRAVCKSYSNVVRLSIVKLIMNNIKK